MKLQISKIKIGERFRKDFGNLEPLKKSIQEIGLLHPVVVNEDNVLVAGERRLRSVQELGWDEVPITRINKSEIKERLEKVVKGEHDENVVRKDFLTTEAVAIWKAMESYQGQQLPSESDGSCLEPRQRASEFLGMGTNKLSQAKQIVESGKQDLIDSMDKTGNVSVAYKKLRKEREKEERKRNLPAIEVEGLIQGDAISKLKELKEKSIDCVVTDPPYNIGFKSVRGADTNDFDDEFSLDMLDSTCKELSRVMKDDSHLYMFIGFQTAFDYINIVSKYFDVRNLLVWVKNNHTPTNYQLNYAHKYELIIFASKGKRILNRDCTPDVLEFKNPTNKLHSCEKPLDLLEYLIENSTIKGEVVLDCFAGSGSTLVASENIGRKWVGIELKKEFINLIKSRLKSEKGVKKA
jgi:site-specific DNA-methyltransferase (adenine-specific)